MPSLYPLESYFEISFPNKKSIELSVMYFTGIIFNTQNWFFMVKNKPNYFSVDAPGSSAYFDCKYIFAIIKH